MQQAPLILPVGTQIVTHKDIHNTAGDVLFTAGAVGVIVKSPADVDHSYRVRLMDGTEVTLKREEFSIRSHFQNPTAPENYLASVDLYQHVIYRCITGSQAYGLAEEDSDVDRRGIYLPPAELHWSLFGIPDQLEYDAEQETYWEIQKFIVLALKANPNIMECLFTPLVEHATPLAQELLEMRQIFVSKLIYQTYNGYVMSQFRKLRHHLENHGTIKWKHAMHLIRLLLSGIETLQTGIVPVDVGQHRDHLLEIRRGKRSWPNVNEWRLQLHKEFEIAFQETKLPDRPDYERANAFLIRARREAL